MIYKEGEPFPVTGLEDRLRLGLGWRQLNRVGERPLRERLISIAESNKSRLILACTLAVVIWKGILPTIDIKVSSYPTETAAPNNDLPKESPKLKIEVLPQQPRPVEEDLLNIYLDDQYTKEALPKNDFTLYGKPEILPSVYFEFFQPLTLKVIDPKGILTRDFPDRILGKETGKGYTFDENIKQRTLFIREETQGGLTVFWAAYTESDPEGKFKGFNFVFLGRKGDWSVSFSKNGQAIDPNKLFERFLFGKFPNGDLLRTL